ncbi:MAG: LpqB family beta-propeller domain-containing protein [Pseudolysinimonas sp.]|uniref:LpqB family beta-propeller domain-containing protein n=1 Tax=Pseudolysinimonas sp. TaxID=2680009 RepID=UPI003266170F
MIRQRLGLVPLLGLAVLLAGCVGIPTSGSVQSAEIKVDSDENPQVSLPDHPTSGQSQEEILQGFIRAGRGPQNGFNVAKEFLAPKAEWSGTAQVLITSSAIAPVRTGEDTLTITVDVTAEVDATGRYVALAVPSTQTLTYVFSVVDGENRILTAAPGIVLTPGGFTGAFDSHPLYFFDPSFRYLVPDLRWFPAVRAAADRIVSELLTGPSPLISSPVTISAFPLGTVGQADLAAPRVSVDLSASVGAESPITQRRMIQQLTASLVTLPNVGEVVVTAGGLSLAPAPESLIPDSQYQVRDPIGEVNGQFGTIVLDGITALPSIGNRIDALQPVAVSLSRTRDTAVVLGAGGVSIVGPTGDPVVVDKRPGLVTPTIDPQGYAWSVPANQPDGLIAVGADGTSHSVPLDADGTVIAIELSRDGTRLLAGLSTPDGPRLFVAGVQRDANLAPVALSSPLELRQSDPILDVAWLDGSTVAILSAGVAGSRVDVIPLGGPEVSLGPVENGVQIVGGNLQEGLRVLSSDGSVLRPSSAGGWVNTGFRASFLGTQQ